MSERVAWRTFSWPERHSQAERIVVRSSVYHFYNSPQHLSPQSRPHPPSTSLHLSLCVSVASSLAVERLGQKQQQPPSNMPRPACFKLM